MFKKLASQKSFPVLILIFSVIFFMSSFIRGSILVKKSEKELSSRKQIEEAQAKVYSLKEIDSTTGELRWELTAEEGETKENLQAAIIKNINAFVYKNKKVVFELKAPFAKANSKTKDIYLYGDVTAHDKSGDFLLHSNQVALGMGTSIEAQKGFKLILKNEGVIEGESALINDDQTKIITKDLREASFKDITISGKEVQIDKEKEGSVKKATILNGGKVVFKNNENLSAGSISWESTGKVEATSNVIYNSQDKTFKANYLKINEKKELYAKENVELTHGGTKCYGKSLSFTNNEQIILTGNPKALQGTKQIQADKITYDINTKKVEAEGNVKTILTDNALSNKP